MSTATTSSQIIEQTALFLSETISQPHHRRHLHTTFLQKLPPTLLKPLTFISQTVETAISSSSPSVRASSLHLAESHLSSTPTNPFSSFLLSLVHHLSRCPLDASLTLLDVFEAEPSLSRLEIAPFLFQELFLIHFGTILEWYDGRRSEILSGLGLESMSILSAAALKELERGYEGLLEDNCRVFARYFKQVLRRGGGEEMILPPKIVFRECESDDRSTLWEGDDE